MANETDRETPSQGLFIGYLALALLALAVVVGLWGVISGMTHPAVF